MKNTALIQARERTGLTQRGVAERARIPVQSYNRYELGKRIPNAPTANRIAKILDSSSEELFGT